MLNMTIGTLELLLKKTNPRTKNPTLLFKAKTFCAAVSQWLYNKQTKHNDEGLSCL